MNNKITITNNSVNVFKIKIFKENYNKKKKNIQKNEIKKIISEIILQSQEN